MYAVIKTGGKQYRVSPGDLLVIEKLDGAPGDAVKFDQVLLTGGDAGVTLGAPTIAGAVVDATLIETRKGEKVKVFKKIRRQGYKRTKGHRQQETVVRVTGLTVGGKSTKWDGTVDLTPLSELQLRARNLAARVEYVPVEEAPKAKAKAPKAAEAHVETVVEAEGKSPEVKAAVVETNAPDVATVEAPAKAKAAPKAKAEAKADAAPKAAKAKAETTEAPKAKKPAAPKAPKA